MFEGELPKLALDCPTVGQATSCQKTRPRAKPGPQSFVAVITPKLLLREVKQGGRQRQPQKQL